MMDAMKAQPREMIEGSEAWERFQKVMRAVISVPKSAILKDEKKRRKQERKND